MLGPKRVIKSKSKYKYGWEFEYKLQKQLFYKNRLFIKYHFGLSWKIRKSQESLWSKCNIQIQNATQRNHLTQLISKNENNLKP